MKNEINVAIIGVGNNASSLVQGWRGSIADPDARTGAKLNRVGAYSVGDLRFVCAFDVATNKVGRDLSEAILMPPNNFPHLVDVPPLGCEVERGPRLDALGEAFVSLVPVVEGDGEPDLAQVADLLRSSGTHVVVNFLPTGSASATRFYAVAAATAGCAFINATPDPIVHDRTLVEQFEERRLPLLGDDLESQMGATVVHRALLEMLEMKGVQVTGSYQLNVGGNMDFRNLLVRGESKRRSKIRALRLPRPNRRIEVIPAAAQFEFLGDRKIAHIKIETQGWLESANTLEVRLEIQDSSSGASVAADLIRIAKFELDLGVGGVIQDAGFYFKNPIRKLDLKSAALLLDRYEAGHDTAEVANH